MPVEDRTSPRSRLIASHQRYSDIPGSEQSTAPARRQLYSDAWERCSDRIHVLHILSHYFYPQFAEFDFSQTTLSNLHDTSLSKIIEFVDNSPDTANSLIATLLGKPLLRTGLIIGSWLQLQPTLTSLTRRIMIGAQPGSSSTLFDTLCRQLGSSNDKKRTPCRVSRISSRSCGNVKAAMRSIINGFVGTGESFDDDGEDDEGELVSLVGFCTSRSQAEVNWSMSAATDCSTRQIIAQVGKSRSGGSRESQRVVSKSLRPVVSPRRLSRAPWPRRTAGGPRISQRASSRRRHSHILVRWSLNLLESLADLTSQSIRFGDTDRLPHRRRYFDKRARLSHPKKQHESSRHRKLLRRTRQESVLCSHEWCQSLFHFTAIDRH